MANDPDFIDYGCDQIGGERELPRPRPKRKKRTTA